jgi:hypothetical protein
MERKLFNYYSIDECSNVDKLHQELNKFVEEGVLDYKLEDRDIVKITDIDLTEDQVEDIEKILDGLDVFPYLDYNNGQEDSDDDYYGDSDWDENEY